MTKPIETVAIVGVGLIGGSFALALKSRGFRGTVLGVSRPAVLDRALGKGLIDRGGSLDEVIPSADLIYLSRPISRILEDLPLVARLAQPDALVTDAGSTKREIVDAAMSLFNRGAEFLGGHPLAGKEQRGVDQAQADLFAGHPYLLTPPNGELPDSPRVAALVEWIRRIGARAEVLSPLEHDRVVAWTSHLPQLISTSLASVLGEAASSGIDLKAAAGPGLRDMTRLGASPWEMWRDILTTNRSEIEQALDTFIEVLQGVRQHLDTPHLEEQFDAARSLREKIFGEDA